MAGRKRIHHEAFDRPRVYQEVPVVRGHLVQQQMPHPAILEEELDMQHAELQRLFDVNRTLVDDRIVMQQDLSASKKELHHLNVILVETRTEREARSRNLLEKNTKMEADLLASEPLHMEAAQLQAEVQKLNKTNKDLTGKIQNIMKDISKLQADNQQRPKLQADIGGFHQELLRARYAVEYEKKEKSRLIEQRQTMEKNLAEMARDLEKLCADLVSSDAHSRTSVSKLSALLAPESEVRKLQQRPPTPKIPKPNPPTSVAGGSTGAGTSSSSALVITSPPGIPPPQGSTVAKSASNKSKDKKRSASPSPTDAPPLSKRQATDGKKVAEEAANPISPSLALKPKLERQMIEIDHRSKAWEAVDDHSMVNILIQASGLCESIMSQAGKRLQAATGSVLKKENADLQRSLSQTKAKYNETANSLKAEQSKSSRLSTEVKVAKEKLTSSEAKVKTLNDKVLELEKLLNEAKDEATKVKQAHDAEAETLARERDNLQIELEAATAKIESAGADAVRADRESKEFFEDLTYLMKRPLRLGFVSAVEELVKAHPEYDVSDLEAFHLYDPQAGTEYEELCTQFQKCARLAPPPDPTPES